jgi:protein-S-isoprenylcysteine O-methyltransferase Ste14
MTSLSRKALGAVDRFHLAMALLLFATAGTLRWWEGWLLWLAFLGGVAALTGYFLRRDPALVERRLAVGPGAERRPRQRALQAGSSLLLLALLVVAGLDRRWGWSVVPAPVVLAADLGVGWALWLFFRVFRANSDASATVGVRAGQRVASDGPYAVVRHPMYSASVVLFAAMPLALGSWAALGPGLALPVVLVARLLDEERVLSAELPGYREYCGRVRWRLVPGVY